MPLWLDRRVALGAGNVFARYAAVYAAVRFVFELMGSDYANVILGWRVALGLRAAVRAGAAALLATF